MFWRLSLYIRFAWHELPISVISGSSCSAQDFEIYIVKCITNLFLFISEEYSVMWIYYHAFILLMNTWVVSNYWILWIKMLGKFVCTSLCENVFSSYKYLLLQLLGHRTDVCLALLKSYYFIILLATHEIASLFFARFGLFVIF